MRLIHNELIKIFNRKSTYIFLLIISIFVLYTTYFYRYKLDSIDLITFKDLIMNFFSEYEFIIIIFIIFISSNIICEEYTKGTIKQLLILPYNRESILLSKIFTSFIIMKILIIYIFLLQLIIGKIFFSYSIDESILVNEIININIFKYLLSVFLTKLPMFIMIIIINIFLGIIIQNSSLTNIISFINYILITPIINMLSLKYYINYNWDFSKYLFSSLNYKTSLIIYLLYLIIIIIISLIIFKKRDVKCI